jgi:hypothetical protein
MNKTLFLLLSLVLCCAAVLLHLPALDSPLLGPQDFTQGAYRPLVTAEKELSSGQPEAALRHFQLAAMRAIHVGRSDVYDRIRFRLGDAGKALAAASFAAGWPYLARFALWAEAFDPNARWVEGWALSHVRTEGRFSYPIVLTSGPTVWGDVPERIPLWIPLMFMAAEREELVSQMGGQLPEDGRSEWLYLYPVRWRQVHGAGECALTTFGRGATAQRWYIKHWGPAAWLGPLTGRDELSLEGDWSLAILGAVGRRHPKEAEVSLVRIYRPL